MKNLKNIKRYLLVIMCALMLFGGSTHVKAASYSAGTYQLTGESKMRQGPGKNYKVVAYISKGKKVNVNTIKNGKWAKVTYKKKSGYISLRYTKKLSGKLPGKKKSVKKITSVQIRTLKVVSQRRNGYPLGCEGVSLYMAMKAKGYLKKTSLKQFMKTMPRAKSNPNNGYVGDPTKGAGGVNSGKRTTIYPKPLAKWGRKYGKVKSLQGASIATLKSELNKKHILVIYATVGWGKPVWKKYSFGKSVRNNHALCLVGYDKNRYLICDCGGSKGRGYYWISKSRFEKVYNARKFAVSVS